jgi:hypothetical protein
VVMIAAGPGWWRRLALYRTPPRGPAPRAAHDENMLRVARGGNGTTDSGGEGVCGGDTADTVLD